jgi:hypothetical protein
MKMLSIEVGNTLAVVARTALYAANVATAAANKDDERKLRSRQEKA